METDESSPNLDPPTIAKLQSARARVASARLSRRARSSAARRESSAAKDVKELSETRSTQGSRRSLQQSRFNARLEEDWNVSTMEELKDAFFSTSDGVLNSSQFISALESYTKNKGASSYLSDLFDKIDASNHRAITWDEFATYMLLEYQKKADTYARSKQVALETPAKAELFPVRSSCANLRINSANQLVMLQDNGTVSFWSPDLTCTKSHKLNMRSRQKPKPTWCTDICLLEHHGLFVVTSGERELWFFRLSTMEAVFVITHLDDTPLRMDKMFSNSDNETILIIGDHQGCLVAFHFPDGFMDTPELKNSIRVTMDSFRQANRAIGGIFYTRWIVHHDWVSQLMYCSQLRMVISACNDEETALVIGDILRPALQEPTSIRIDPQGPSSQYFHHGASIRKNHAQSVFRVKRGVRSFAYIPKGNLIATGGLDRAIWLWNPYVTFQAAGVLRGHTAPIHHVCINPIENRLYSISVDSQLLVWDVVDMVCLCVISQRRHKVFGDPTGSALFIPADRVYSIRIQNRLQRKDEVVSHDNAVTCCTLNSRFKHLVTGSKDGTIKITVRCFAALITRVNSCALRLMSVHFESLDEDAHDPSNGLTAMTFDSSMRRLITAQVKGTIKAWNYGNGQLLRVFDKQTDKEVTCLIYLEHGMLRRLAVGGWDRRLFLFKDVPEDDLHMAPVHPLPTRAAIKHHSDDIQGLCFYPPSTLVTSSYDGQVKAWNVTSMNETASIDIPQHPLPRRRSQRRLSSTSPRVEQMMEERNLPDILSLKTRGNDPNIATIIACGCYGCIYFFSLVNLGRIVAWFSVENNSSTITRIIVTKSEQFLVVGDDRGQPQTEMKTILEEDDDQPIVETSTGKSVKKLGHSISLEVTAPDSCSLTNNNEGGSHHYSADSRDSVVIRRSMFDMNIHLKDAGPPLISEWQAHLDSITSLELIEDSSLIGVDAESIIISASKDQRCRTWGFRGQFIGTFGQDITWDLLSPVTWEHPDRPAEIVKFEQSETKRLEEEEAIRREMDELGIYDDDGANYDSDDEDLRAQTPYRVKRDFGSERSRPISRTSQRPSSSLGVLSLSRPFSMRTQPSGLSRHRRSTNVSERLNTLFNGKDEFTNSRDSIIPLHRSSSQTSLTMLEELASQKSQTQVLGGQARRLSEQRALRRQSSNTTFQKLVRRQSGNWGRHLQLDSHRSSSERIYLALPYHNLTATNGSGKS
eukprot:gene623-3933_t